MDKPPELSVAIMCRNNADTIGRTLASVAPLAGEIVAVDSGSTDGTIILFPASGTGIWESALTNTLARTNKVLTSRFGQFSHLWIDMAQRIGLDVIVQEEEWGTGADPAVARWVVSCRHRHAFPPAQPPRPCRGGTGGTGGTRPALAGPAHGSLHVTDCANRQRSPALV